MISNSILINKFKKQNESNDKNTIESLSEKAKKWLLLFFLIMCGLTVLSHIADSLTVPRVKIGKVQKLSLNFAISGNGTIVENSNDYIKVEENLRVTKVYIKSGDIVKEGDVLFEYDMDDIKKLYDDDETKLRKAQIEKDKLVVGKDKLNDKVDIYGDALNNLRGMEDVQNARDEVTKAKKEYEQAYEKAVKKAEKESNDDVKEKQEIYDKAEKEYQDMKISNTEDILKAERDVEDAEDKLRIVKKYCKKGDDDDNADHIYKKSDVAEAEKILERAQDDLDRINEKCDYNLENAEKNLDKAKKNLEDAGKEPFDYDSELSSSVDKIEAANKNLSELIRKSEDAENVLNDEQEKKSIEENNQEVESKIDDLDIDSQDVDIQVIKKDIDRLNKIIQNNGKVSATVSGVINKMEIEEGKTTTGQELVSISFDKCSIEGIVTKEDAKKVSCGDDIYIKINDKDNPIESTISSIGSPDSDGMVKVIAVMPDGNYQIGAEVSFELKKNSRKYDKCIPIEALRSDSQGKYVLVISQRNTVLGEEDIAERVKVDVIDNNYLNAAINGEITEEEKIIIGSSRNIEENDRVRVDEND